MSLSKDALFELASEATGLRDFGDADFEEGLDVLLEAYANESKLSALGLEMVRQELVGDLVGRLQVVDFFKHRPDIRESPIEGPIFIVGLPRTGTTALHQLAQHDPESQVLEYWLGVAPQPRPPQAAWASNAHYQRVAEVLRLQYEADPGLRAIHDVSADGPGECRFAFRHLFMDDSYDFTATLPSYRAWIDRQSMDRAYRWYRDVLSLIESESPGRRWVLKYPSHLHCLPEIFSVFPDARIIQTHRDPAQVLPSFASLLAGFTAVYEGGADSRAIGRLVFRLWSERIRKSMQDRAELDREDRFFDLQFRDVLENPVDSMARAFRHFDQPLSAEAITHMTTWLEAHPAERHGRHDYTAESFGLDPVEMSRSFVAYREHFGIAEE